MSRVLVCDPIDEEGIKMIKSAGLDIDYKPSITPSELKQVEKDFDSVSS